MDFSLFFFDGEGSIPKPNQYRLLLESAQYADRNGFVAVWTPERHFHAFGGLYPNPALTSAALAPVTERIKLRAGSLVAPLHHPVRIAEDWSVIDNLSHGRAEIAFASGWTMDEFVLSRRPHASRRELLWETLATASKLWEGQEVEFLDATGKAVSVKTLPRPIQPQLPFWITAQSEDTFIKAAEAGANVLTSLLNVSLDDLHNKVARYRQVLAEKGFDPSQRKVAVMLHTFLGENPKAVAEEIRGPFCEYLSTHYHLLDSLAKSMGLAVSLSEFSQDDIDTLLEFGYRSFINGRSLIGSPESCLPLVRQLGDAGVSEIACLVDFNPSFESAMHGLPYLKALKDACNDCAPALAPVP
ncbi:MupA/Atu3671 family FMN-dependent luciferase-like monooxygenase [Synechococcus sp. PCC 7336]|uniref:MupA/Atu3671 family FMN-dependent luciferase-like monooxygenase n=1 Tax=Synechococcus sp. PCC 7336 TaxID=195250 RepID=UPI00034DEE95|nr:MupA/Atu3671 family FMN-dependent luciferase-like monooxygenase [Synechococcus sp. PCC 7336]